MSFSLDAFPDRHRAALSRVFESTPAEWHVALFGGAVRDAVLGAEPNDLDFLVEGARTDLDVLRWLAHLSDEGCVVTKTGFGGGRATVLGVQIDAWRVEDNHLGPPQATIAEVLRTGITFDVEGVAILRHRDNRGYSVLGNGWDAIESRVVDVPPRGARKLLRPYAPMPFTLARAAKLALRCGFAFGPNLRELVEMDLQRRDDRSLARGGSYLSPPMSADEARAGLRLGYERGAS